MIKRILYTTMICIFLLFNTSVMAVDFTNNRVVDIYKNWTIKFNNEIDYEELSFNDISVIDSSGYYVDVEINLGPDRKSIIVNSPSEGYKPGEKYILFINDTIHSKNNVYLKNSVEMEFIIESTNSISKIMDKLIVLPETYYDEYEAEQMISRISRIDEEMLKALANVNVKIKLANTNVTGVDEYAHLAGVIPRGWEYTGKTWDDVPGVGGNPVVARIGHSEPSYENGHGCVNLELHETAHAIDYFVFGDISKQNKFCNIMDIESQNLFPNNGYVDKYPEEYFADTFAMYYLNDETKQELKEKAPLTYKFFQELSNNLSEQEYSEEAA